MDNQSFQVDIETAEALDEHLSEQSIRIADISGSLEAIGQSIVGDEEPQQLSEHQQEMVDAFRKLSKDHKGPVYAVADAAALEGFMELTASIARKAVISFGNEIPANFKLTGKALIHYSRMSQNLRERLVKLRVELNKRDFPLEDVFDYGAYSRFFQVDGKSIRGFTAFKETLELQNKATLHVLSAAQSYGVVVMERLLKSLQELQVTKKPDLEELIALRDFVETHWEYTWKEANLTKKPGQPPQVALNNFPERKFLTLAPLFDNRYLVAHAPKSDGGRDPAKITTAVKHYGASVVFDKKVGEAPAKSMNVPNVNELLEVVDQTINVLHDMRGFEELAKKNDSFAKDVKKAVDILSKLADSSTDPQFYGFVAEYFKLATAVGQAVQQPYVQMAWMYIRSAMIVTALAELSALEESKSRIVTKHFFTKQATDFSNPAMESFQLTQKALNAAKRVRIA